MIVVLLQLSVDTLKSKSIEKQKWGTAANQVTIFTLTDIMGVIMEGTMGVTMGVTTVVITVVITSLCTTEDITVGITADTTAGITEDITEDIMVDIMEVTMAGTIDQPVKPRPITSSELESPIFSLRIT